MSTNINPETGIRYGYISGSSIHSGILDTIMYSVGTNVSLNEAELEAKADVEREAEEIEEEARIAIAERGGYTDREAEGFEEEVMNVVNEYAETFA